MPPELLGPYALTAAVLIAVAVLWRIHLKADDDVRSQRDAAISRLEGMVGALDRNTDANVELAKAFREYIAEQARRQRRGTR